MRITLTVVCVVAVLLFHPHIASACRCKPVAHTLTATKWIAGFDGVVFRGEVLHIVEVQVPVTGKTVVDGYTLNLDVTFKVQESWKESNNSQVTIRTGVGGGDCGVHYQRGRSYFVAANRFEGKLYTGICTMVDLDTNTNPTLGKGKNPNSQ